MPNKPIRVLLVSDRAEPGAGVRAVLEGESDFEVVGEAGTGDEGVKLVGELKPDVVVVDLSIPPEGGLDATKRIAGRRGAPKVLVLATHAGEDHVMPVLDAGGSGVVLKTSAEDDLTRAIRTVARDEVFLYPAAAGLRVGRYRVRKREKDPLETLTGRERDVLTMTAEGYTSREIGEKLLISPKTVDTYRARVMEKLRLTHRTELVRFALDNGLLARS